MEEFAGVLAGSLIGAIAGWWLMVRENQRQAFLRLNTEHLSGLGRAIRGYLLDAATTDDATKLAILKRSASSIARDHMGPFADAFTSVEKQALSKIEVVRAARRARVEGRYLLPAWGAWPY